MASLKSTTSGSDLDPRISFNLDLVGFFGSREGEPNEDWLEVKIGIDIFGSKLERPGKNAISKHEMKAFIEWLRKLVDSKAPFPPFQTTHEPLFQISTEPVAGPIFEITALISAYGTVPGFYIESSGVDARFRTDENALRTFADRLESELSDIGRGKLPAPQQP